MGSFLSSNPLCGNVCICNSTKVGPSFKIPTNNDRKGKIKLLLIGLDNAGKTTTVMHLMGRPIDDVVPTIGFSNLEMKLFNKFPVEIYDLGGGAKIRSIWKNYFALVHGIIYVVDSADEDRIPEVRQNLEDVLKHDRISKKPILVLVNKQDVEGALEEIDMSQQLNLSFLANTYQCPTRIESTSATNSYDVVSKGGEREKTMTTNTQSSSNISSSNNLRLERDAGIEAGYSWLVSFILKNWTSLNARVEQETEEQVNIEKQVMNERYRRFRKNSVSQVPSSHDNEEKDVVRDGVTSHLEPETTLTTGVYPVEETPSSSHEDAENKSRKSQQVLTPHAEKDPPDSVHNRRQDDRNQHPLLPNVEEIASPTKSTDEDEGVDVRGEETNHENDETRNMRKNEELILDPMNLIAEQDPSNPTVIQSPETSASLKKSKRRSLFSSNKIIPSNS